jgi:hypothetical protein
MELKDILRNEELHGLFVDTGFPSNKREGFNSICKSTADSLDSEEFFLPVLGVQGSGKSTLLNALCFDIPVLPIDADETTAVPVEIKRRGPGQPEARVSFRDGPDKVLALDQGALNTFVHQEHNPGNLRGVTKLSVESEAPFLAGGLVLVDLPGLGSLTEANRRTTTDYLKGASGLICILRTTPTVTSSEAKDIKTHWWTKRYNTFFVQNVWNDEGNKDVDEGVSYNQEVVDKIAKEVKIEYDGREPQFRIMPVNAYAALKARVTGESTQGTVYGPEKLAALLTRLGARWKSESLENARRTLLSFIDSSLESLSTSADALSSDRASAERNIEDVHSRKVAEIARLRKLNAEAEDMLYSLRREIRNICSNWKTDEGEHLRNRMRELAHQGVTDGDRLNDAFSTYTQTSHATLTEMIQDSVSRFEDNIEAMFNQLADVSGLDIAYGGAQGYVLGEQGPRFREHLGKIGGVAGGLAPLLAATAVAIPLALPLLALAGAVSAVLGAIMGGKARESLADKQRDQILAQIPALVDGFVNTTADAASDSIARFCADFDTWSEEQYRAMQEGASRQYETDLASRRKTADELEKERGKLKQRIDSLGRFRALAATAT